ncbi:MAG: hypothetical protein HOY71_34110, partial [Nonomuraea sp.]|nr:hypothetical protein [Nonomuraea sp.]
MVEITRRTVFKAGAASAFIATAAPGAAYADDLERRAMALDPPVFLLESAVPPQFGADSGSTLSISDRVAVCGTRSLRWEHGSRSVITVRAPLRWAPDPYRFGGD